MATRQRDPMQNLLAIPAGINKRIDYPPEAYEVSLRRKHLVLHVTNVVTSCLAMSALPLPFVPVTTRLVRRSKWE